jgi:hypothetical protein
MPGIRFAGVRVHHSEYTGDHNRFPREGNPVYFKLGDTAYFGFCTHNPATGAVADASSTPTCEIFEENNTSAMAYVPTVAQRGSITGEYEVRSGNVWNRFSAANYNVVISATVAGVTGKKVVGTYVLSKKPSI